LDLGVRVGGLGGIDVPGLQRPTVEGPEDALQGEGGEEDGEGVGERKMLTEAIPTRIEVIRTRFRPSESASPPVGSSRKRTIRPCPAAANPISLRDSPRPSGKSMVTGMISPVGNQRKATRMR
jgi:hypothetical protein